MKKINIFILSFVLAVFSSCESDIDMIQIQEGTSSLLESNIDESTLIQIIEENDQNVIYNLTWTNAIYLNENNDSSVIGEYTIHMATSEDFLNAVTINPTVHLTHGFKGNELNHILVNQIEVVPEESVEVFFRIESTFNNDVLYSNTVSNVFIPYTIEVPPAVWLPSGDIYLWGAAVGAPWPFRAEDKFTQESETVYSKVAFLPGNTEYEILPFQSWAQKYLIPSDVVPADVATAGTFIEDGDQAHDELGNEVSRWVGQNAVSPPEDGYYKITLDFQTGLYTVEPASPVIFLPPNEDVYITGAAVGGPWPFPAEHKFAQESERVYSLVVDLVPNETYEMVADESWNQAYKLPGDVVPADVTLEGSFVEDGNLAHDAEGNEVSRWEGQAFLSPTVAGTYKITLDFQFGTYTVVLQ